MVGFGLIGGKPGPLEVEPARAEVGIGGMWESLADKDDLCINQHQRQRCCCQFLQIYDGSENVQVIKFARSFSHKIFLEELEFFWLD